MTDAQDSRRSADQTAESPSPYAERPFIVIWEVTRACALRCVHCRAEAQYARDPRELNTEESMRLIDDVAALGSPLFVLTGGDPLMRPDLFELAAYAAKSKGLRVALTPSATPKVTREAVRRAKEAGIARWAFSLDGSRADIHDRFRGMNGSFELTMRGISYLRDEQIPLQINTTVSRHNLSDLEAIAERVGETGAVLWSVFFLVPTGRAAKEDMISAEEHEEVMRWMSRSEPHWPFGVKTTEAPHYRRVLIQAGSGRRFQGDDAPFGDTDGASGGKTNGAPAHRLSGRPIAERADRIGRALRPVNDGDGLVFISHIGEVYPSGFLPVVCGNVREQPLSSIYRESPVMRALRDKSLLKGKCGVCEFRGVCGGSRARAFALTGDYLESDPACAYTPGSRT